MRKITAIFMILVLSFAMVFIYPAKQANANPLAVGGALYLGGAGVYVLGAVGVAAIVGLSGCSSCQEDIEAHAARTWEGSTQLAKDALQKMVDASVGAWGATSSALTAVDSDFNTWMNTQLAGYGESALGSKYGVMSAATSKLGCNCTHAERKYVNQADLNYGFFVNGQTYREINIVLNSATIAFTFAYGVKDGATMSYPNHQILIPRLASHANEIFNITTASQALAFAKSSGIPVAFGLTASLMADSAYVLKNATEAWEEMTDAGLVLPVDNALPALYDGSPLSYNPATDSYAGIDGVNVPRDEITFDYQKPHWKTLEDLAMLGLSGLGAGLYIDGWTGSDSITSTYNPTTDSTTTTTDTTTTHTNVNTGETVTSTTSTTTTTTGDTTGNPTTGEPPPPSAPTATNPFKGKVPGASLLGLWELLVALIWYLIRLFTFVTTLALIAPTEIDNPYFQWFTTVQILGITPYPLVQNLALFFLGFSIYKSVRRVF